MRKETHLQKGVTLIELIVAIVITTIVVTILYNSWTYWNRYVARTQAKTELRMESKRILNQITLQIKKAKSVLFWDRDQIGFVREDRGDTVVYNYDYDGAIKCNGEKIVLLPKSATVIDFTIENQNNNREDNVYLFVISIILRNSFNDTVRTEGSVMIKCFEEDNTEMMF